MNRKLAAAAALAAATCASAVPPATALPRLRMPMHDESVAGGGALVALHRLVVHVEIRGFAFRPARLVVSPGTRVVWTNRDGDPHTVTSTTRTFASEALDTGGSFRLVLRRPGAYSYYCAIHPYMHGVVVVRR